MFLIPSRFPRGSVLLIVVLLTSFALLSFAAFSMSVRESIRKNMTDSVQDSLEYDNIARSFQAMGTGALGSWALGKGLVVEAQWLGMFVAYSGTLTPLSWVRSGNLTLSLNQGAPFCFSGNDGIMNISGCTKTSTGIVVASETGTLELRTLGGMSRIIASPATSLTNTGVLVQVSGPVGNLTLPLARLR